VVSTLSAIEKRAGRKLWVERETIFKEYGVMLKASLTPWFSYTGVAAGQAERQTGAAADHTACTAGIIYTHET
jgi:hypothetical protein